MFGFLTLLIGIVFVINPEVIFGLLQNNFDKLELHILAVVSRLILGVLLIYQSNISKFPIEIEIIGWFLIVAAIFLVLMGRQHFKRLMSWTLSLSKPFCRVAGIFAAALGLFLIYAFV